MKNSAAILAAVCMFLSGYVVAQPTGTSDPSVVLPVPAGDPQSSPSADTTTQTKASKRKLLSSDELKLLLPDKKLYSSSDSGREFSMDIMSNGKFIGEDWAPGDAGNRTRAGEGDWWTEEGRRFCYRLVRWTGTKSNCWGGIEHVENEKYNFVGRTTVRPFTLTRR